MQIAAIVDSSPPLKDCSGAVQGQAEPGGFDQLVALNLAQLFTVTELVNTPVQTGGLALGDSADFSGDQETDGGEVNSAAPVQALGPKFVSLPTSAFKDLGEICGAHQPRFSSLQISAFQDPGEISGAHRPEFANGQVPAPGSPELNVIDPAELQLPRIGEPTAKTAGNVPSVPGEPALPQISAEGTKTPNLPVISEEAEKTGEMVLLQADSAQPSKKDGRRELLSVTRTGLPEEAAPSEQAAVINSKNLKGTDVTARVLKSSPAAEPADKAPDHGFVLEEAGPAAAGEQKQDAQKTLFSETGKKAEIVSTSGKANHAEKIPNQNSAGHSNVKPNPAQPQQPQFDLNSLIQPSGHLSVETGINMAKEKLLQEVRQVFASFKGDQQQAQVRLKLDSEHLGPLTIRLFFNNGELSAHFYTESSSVKGFLEGCFQQLRDSLAQQDLRLNEALVFNTGDQGTSPGNYHERWSEETLSLYGNNNYRFYSRQHDESSGTRPEANGISQINYLI